MWARSHGPLSVVLYPCSQNFQIGATIQITQRIILATKISTGSSNKNVPADSIVVIANGPAGSHKNTDTCEQRILHDNNVSFGNVATYQKN